MKRFRKILLWVILPLILLLVIAAFVLNAVIGSFLTRDAIAKRIESEKNCRVLLGEVDASLLGGTVVIHDLVLVQRDEHASAGTPLDERPAPGLDQTGIRVKRLALNANLGDLLKKRLTVNELTVEGLDLSFLINRKGEKDSTTLEPMFDPPELVEGKPNPDYEAKKKRRELAKERRKLAPDDPKAAELAEEIKGFNIGEVPLPATMKKLQIKDAVVNIKLKRDKTRIKLDNLQLSLDDLDVDPENLAAHNSAQLSMDGNLTVTDRDRETVYANLALGGKGKIAPFDAETGFLNPDLVTEITLKEGSEIFSLPLVERLTKALDKLKKAGLDVSDLESTLTVQEDAAVMLGFKDSALRAAGPLAINLNGHDLVMGEGSWLHTGSNEHEITGELTFSEKISGSAFGRANDFLSKSVGLDPSMVTQISDMLFSPVTKENRLYVPFLSTGDFGRPKVRPRVELMDLSDILKGEAKDNALNLLDQLIRKNQ